VDTVQDVLNRFPQGRFPRIVPLTAPVYNPPTNAVQRPRVALAVSSMQNHMTDEGWQLMAGLGAAGYKLCGHGEPLDGLTDVKDIVTRYNPSTLVLQDKREWDVRPGGFRSPSARFMRASTLRPRHDIFKLTVLKDAHQKPPYHAASADEIGCHAWITYYHPQVVSRLAAFVRPQHLVRTYHTLDPAAVPPEPWAHKTQGCLLSGAVSGVYPLRAALFARSSELPDTDVLPHPGYHQRGCATPDFLRTLSRYKVAICTASIYGYTLRKFAEATACGCVVITNLPADDPLPEIDGNLIRISSEATVKEVADLVAHHVDRYDLDRQKDFALRAQQRYSYRAETARLAAEIEALRGAY
jgi:hypothetical protein